MTTCDSQTELTSIMKKKKDIPVNRLVVAFGRDYLRSEIVGRTAQCPCNIRDLFGETKICNLEMSMTIQQ